MSWKMFGQIALLIVIFVLVMSVAKCLKQYCPMANKACPMGSVKAGR